MLTRKYCPAMEFVKRLPCDVAIALCLGALLQAPGFYVYCIVFLSTAMDIVTAVLTLISDFKYPCGIFVQLRMSVAHRYLTLSAKPLSELDKELGYTCYGPSPRRWPTAIGLDIRRYASFAATTVLLVLAVICVVVRYKGHSGRLVNIIRRDGGLYYLAVAGVRFTQSIMDTPTITQARPLSNEGLMVLDGMSNIIVPILAQRLMINLRKVDYIGSQPMASKLLFAASTPDSDDDLGDEVSRPCEDNIELSGSQYRTQAVVASAVQKA
ncbi:hypothetical protein NMY22_g16270 [Coprinellus aureogranulatus]|nr:hypothetical protein NMY22_g16270 [Coprinellus aureogranulatus]